jgi:hypothetical protein
MLVIEHTHQLDGKIFDVTHSRRHIGSSGCPRGRKLHITEIRHFPGTGRRMRYM